MSLLMETAPMPARETPKSKQANVTVKIAGRVHYKARMVSASRNQTVTNYLTELLEKLVDRDYEKLRQEMGREPELNE